MRFNKDRQDSSRTEWDSKSSEIRPERIQPPRVPRRVRGPEQVSASEARRQRPLGDMSMRSPDGQGKVRNAGPVQTRPDYRQGQRYDESLDLRSQKGRRVYPQGPEISRMEYSLAEQSAYAPERDPRRRSQSAQSESSRQGRVTTDPIRRPNKIARRLLKNRKIMSLCFLLILFAGMILFVVWPATELDVAEKRPLQQFPEVSLGKLLDGSFGRSFEKYLADQFPMRGTWLVVNSNFRHLLKGFPGSGEDDLQIVSGKRQESVGAGTIQTTAQPAPSSEQIQNTKSIATTAAPTSFMQKAPELDRNAGGEAQESYNLLIRGNRAMEIFYFAPEVGKAYAERINRLRTLLPSETRVISVLAPTAVAFYGPEKLNQGENDQWQAIRSIYADMSPQIVKVDAYTKLAEHAKEYLYFRTDHHWTGRGAYYAYAAYAEALGLVPEMLNSMKMVQPEGTFLGTLYTYSKNNPVLLSNPDRAEIFIPKTSGNLEAYDNSAFANPRQGVLLNPNIEQSNQYLLYSGGDEPLARITTANKNGRRVLVIKDSYGQAFVPYLMNDYEEVYIIDPRYFDEPVDAFVKAQKINDVVVLNYSFAISNPTWLKGFDNITGVK